MFLKVVDEVQVNFKVSSDEHMCTLGDFIVFVFAKSRDLVISYGR